MQDHSTQWERRRSDCKSSTQPSLSAAGVGWWPWCAAGNGWGSAPCCSRPCRMDRAPRTRSRPSRSCWPSSRPSSLEPSGLPMWSGCVRTRWPGRSDPGSHAHALGHDTDAILGGLSCRAKWNTSRRSSGSAPSPGCGSSSLGAVRDLDSTVFESFGHQEGPLKGHNPRKHGRPSRHPFLAKLAEVKPVCNV